MLDSQKNNSIFIKQTYSINERVLINENFNLVNKTQKKLIINFENGT